MQPETENSKGVRDELVTGAKGVGASAVNRLHSEVVARKGDAVEQVKSVSSTIERAVSDLDDSAPSWLKSALEQGSQHLQKLADTIEQNDSRQIVDQVNQFARNSPATFLASCAAAGFAAARIFKAGAGEADAGPSGADNADQDFPPEWQASAVNVPDVTGAGYDGEVV
jgi:ElaB/YqjD/DUF883 family membrane-anchored ribosome-binding protein